jgi:hypothetical protein
MRVTAAAPKAAKAVSLTVKADGEDRLRLHNLSPLKGSRKAKTRKGRGYGAGQVSILVPSTESFADAHACHRAPPSPKDAQKVDRVKCPVDFPSNAHPAVY